MTPRSGWFLVLAIAAGLVLIFAMTSLAIARVDQFGGDSFTAAYAPYTAGPTVDEEEAYAPYTAGPVVPETEEPYAPYEAGPVVPKSAVPYAPYTAGPVVPESAARIGQYLRD